MYEEARKILRDIAVKNIDWPEAIWEAWVSFEHVHGSVEELEDCLDRIERARKQVNAKRAKVRAPLDADVEAWEDIDHCTGCRESSVERHANYR